MKLILSILNLKIKQIKLPAETKTTILITKEFIKSINLSTLGSYLKYEKV